MATAVQQIKTYRLEPDQRGAEAAGFELGDVISIDWVQGYSTLTFTKCPERARLQDIKPSSPNSVRATITKANGGAASIGIINLPRRLTRM